MPDAIFAEPRLAEIYDLLDPDRSDLDPYTAMADEFGARSVLDVGCGTGTLACLLVGRGLEVTTIDPAGASLAVARRKPGADHVRRLHTDAAHLPRPQADLAIMTGNVAQVFVADQQWAAPLRAVRQALSPRGTPRIGGDDDALRAADAPPGAFRGRDLRSAWPGTVLSCARSHATWQRRRCRRSRR